MDVNGKGFPWRHCCLMTSRHAMWSCSLSVGNALSTANLFLFEACYYQAVNLENIEVCFGNTASYDLVIISETYSIDFCTLTGKFANFVNVKLVLYFVTLFITFLSLQLNYKIPNSN